MPGQPSSRRQSRAAILRHLLRSDGVSRPYPAKVLRRSEASLLRSPLDLKRGEPDDLSRPLRQRAIRGKRGEIFPGVWAKFANSVVAHATRQMSEVGRNMPCQ